MTLYIKYKSQTLSCHWRPDGNLAVRLQRLQHKCETLIIHINDLLIIEDKRGRMKWTCSVDAFVPHLQYGGFVRSGRVVCRNVTETDLRSSCAKKAA